MENVFYVNNVNVLLKVKESKCISIIMLKLLNISFLEFLKILIRQNSVYWVIMGKLFLLTRWELLFNRFKGNSLEIKDRDNTEITDKEVFRVTCSSNCKFFVMKILAYYKNLWMIYIIIIYRYLIIVTKKYYTRNIYKYMCFNQEKENY